MAAAGSLWLAGSSLLGVDGLSASLEDGIGGENVVLASALRSGRRCGTPLAIRASAASLTLSVRFSAPFGSLEVVPAKGEPGLPGSLLPILEAAEIVAEAPAGGRGKSRRTLARFVRPTTPVAGESGVDEVEEVRVG